MEITFNHNAKTRVESIGADFDKVEAKLKSLLFEEMKWSEIIEELIKDPEISDADVLLAVSMMS
jgi:hypothetical protein